MLLDIENQGTEVVFKYLRDDSDGPEERVEVIKTITSQYTSFREFSETVNNLIYHLSKLLSLNNLPDLLTYLSMTLKKVYKCDNVRLWLDDKLTGVLYTYNEKTVMMRSVIGKGYLGKMTDFPLNSIDFYLYKFYTLITLLLDVTFLLFQSIFQVKINIIYL